MRIDLFVCFNYWLCLRTGFVIWTITEMGREVGVIKNRARSVTPSSYKTYDVFPCAVIISMYIDNVNGRFTYLSNRIFIFTHKWVEYCLAKY